MVVQYHPLQRASFVGAMNCLNGYGAKCNVVDKAALNGALPQIPG